MRAPLTEHFKTEPTCLLPVKEEENEDCSIIEPPQTLEYSPRLNNNYMEPKNKKNVQFQTNLLQSQTLSPSKDISRITRSKTARFTYNQKCNQYIYIYIYI